MFSLYFEVIGNLLSRPNARFVILTPGADCRLLYSLLLTREATFSTVDKSCFEFAICEGVKSFSMYCSRIGSRMSYGGSESVSFWLGANSAVGGQRDTSEKGR